MEEKLRVCLVNDSFPPVIDGVANAVTNYAGIIQRHHGQSAVVTPYYPGADDSSFLYPVYRYPSLDFTKLVGYRAGFPLSAELMAQLEAQSFNVIHSHCPVSSTVLARLLRPRIHAPLVFTYHTKFDIDIASAIHSKLLQEAAIRVLVQNISACDEVWTVSHGAGENLRSLGYQGAYTVMPNGVDFPVGRVAQEKIDAACQDYDLPAEVPVYLFVGRLQWYKGLRIILDALQSLQAEGQDFRMVFIGRGTDSDEVRAYAEKLGLSHRVLFVPPIYDRDVIRAWYCRADLFLFPSTFDTNGLVVREAAACALGSVLIRGSCAAEDIADGQTGFLIEENADAMAAMLRRLSHHREAVRQVGENAQRDIYISWEDAVADACRRYGTVLENYRAGVYPIHDAPSDELLNTVAELMGALYQVKARQLAKQRAAEENLQTLKGSVRGEKEKVQAKLDELWQRFDRFL